MNYINIHTHVTRDDATQIVTVGIHPWDAESVDTEQLQLPLASAQAIGEIGLDFACTVDRNAQKALFNKQLQIAEQSELPVVLHCVKAFEPTMKMLEAHPLKAVIFHGFIGSSEQMQQAIARGYYLSFGERTFSSPRTVEALRHAPSTNIFLETDVSDTPISEIYRCAAETRGVDIERLKEQIEDNYKRIFDK